MPGTGLAYIVDPHGLVEKNLNGFRDRKHSHLLAHKQELEAKLNGNVSRKGKANAIVFYLSPYEP